ncbi:hypothetical protein NM208_g9509 [Fusarium decemcellulare]|uniref:Uncharacterized protein n=1 Tax=Fusarium decemcellulare TaxID=57161 RepID=A0ACC1S1L2_9HYPO|nr:hypothetical protein NM208_g9509 [Fusarium decemcellulare]
MGAALDTQKLNSLFQARPDILQGIQRAADSPGRISLFNEIANHVYDQLQGSSEPAHKKRRVDVQQTNGTVNGKSAAVKPETNAADEPVLLEIKEISVSVPQRKKFELYIEYLFYVPVPEKTQVQHNYILFPRGTCLPSKTNPPTEEPLVFTVPATSPKHGTIGGPKAGTAEGVADNYKSLFHWAFNQFLKTAGNNVEITSANPNKFQSMVRQPHRPNEKAVHVKAFRGSKDGYLFFLENGILWGFKKPLMFIPLNRVAATSYTNILQRTFNIAVEVFAGEGDATEEIEFSMLDQEDYGGIDDYIKQNRLQDRSMAEQRKAKLELAENRGPKKNADGTENGATDGQDGQTGMSELAKAQLEAEQELQDEEDEDEEDYDPGSDADSDGSGDSSDDDSDDDEDDEDDEGEDGEDGEGEEEEEAAEEEEEEQPKEPTPPPVQKATRKSAAKVLQRLPRKLPRKQRLLPRRKPPRSPPQSPPRRFP